MVSIVILICYTRKTPLPNDSTSVLVRYEQVISRPMLMCMNSLVPVQISEFVLI